MYQLKNGEFMATKTTTTKTSGVMSGHGTTVVRRTATLGGEIVDKTMKPDGIFKDKLTEWMNSNIRARVVANKIHDKNNPAYNVPRTFISHGRVREQFAPGRPLRDLPQKYLKDNIPSLIWAVANFINDMSELEPVRTDMPPAKTIKRLGIKDIDALNKLLDAADTILNTKDKNLIRDIFVLLRDLPENNKYVFSHNDLHGQNIMVDEETGRVSIIDFEFAGYASMFNVMYRTPNTRTKQLWDAVNKLPRTTNPNLYWDFDPDKGDLVYFMQVMTAAMRKYVRNAERYGPEETEDMTLAMALECNNIRMTFGRVKVKVSQGPAPRPISALVTKNHYRR